MRITDADGTTTGQETKESMRIDPCPSCGERVNIASDHAPDCKRKSRIVGSTLLQTGAVLEGSFEMVKLRFHEDGSVTWQKLWNQ